MVNGNRVNIMVFSIFTLSVGYNLETSYYKRWGIFKKNSTGEIPSNYFGFASILFADPSGNSWLIVGAPKINLSNVIEPGCVYRCPLYIVNNEDKSIDTRSCYYIKPNLNKHDTGIIKELQMTFKVKKERGWFGASMSLHRPTGTLTVCAPRTIVSIRNPVKRADQETMHGVCYQDKFNATNINISDNIGEYNFSSPYWYNPLRGFSIHQPQFQANSAPVWQSDSHIIGQPKHEIFGTVDVLSENGRKSVELPSSDELSEFGYSVTSGNYFKKNRLLFAAGAPGWRYVGRVGIIDPNVSPTIISTLDGTNIGEYFGASLASGDINNDGLDDIIIGAPHWSNDNGRVYVFLGSNNGGFLQGSLILDGSLIEDAQFGYSVSAGDIDKDGFHDIIVGAPWEGQGVVYIYNGDYKVRENSKLRFSQRIKGIQINNEILRFGFSISDPWDIDGNGFPDIAIGAYLKNEVIVLHSIPVVETKLSVVTIPKTLPRNSTDFILNICVEHRINHKYKIQGYTLRLKIDEDYERTNSSLIESTHYPKNVSSDLRQLCSNQTIGIAKNVSNFIDPIDIFIEHRFSEFANNNKSSFCKTCPIEYRGIQAKIIKSSISFDIGCGNDKICTSSVSMTDIEIHGVTSENNTWIIGSNDISIRYTIFNSGEPAYQTQIVHTIPNGVTLRSVLPSCQEDSSNETVRIICDVANPLFRGELKSLELDFDLKHINASWYQEGIPFATEITTLSVNQGDAHRTTYLKLRSDASLILTGLAREEEYYIPSNITVSNNRSLNIHFQHVYQVLKTGVTPISNLELTINVPISFKNLEAFIYLRRPLLHVSGKLSECSIEQSLPLFQNRMVDILPEEEETEEEELLSPKLFLRNRRGIKDNDLRVDTDNKLQVQEWISTQEYHTEKSNYWDNVTYLNCSMKNVKCGQIKCHIDSLRTAQDVGKVLLDLIFNVTKFKETSGTANPIIKLNTEAWIEISVPSNHLLDTNSSNFAANLTTTFYKLPAKEKLTIWIILISVFLGLTLLFVIITVLSKLGFFQRQRKEELDALKNSHTDLNVTDENIDSEIAMDKVSLD